MTCNVIDEDLDFIWFDAESYSFARWQHNFSEEVCAIPALLVTITDAKSIT